MDEILFKIKQKIEMELFVLILRNKVKEEDLIDFIIQLIPIKEELTLYEEFKIIIYKRLIEKLGNMVII